MAVAAVGTARPASALAVAARAVALMSEAGSFAARSSTIPGAAADKTAGAIPRRVSRPRSFERARQPAAHRSLAAPEEPRGVVLRSALEIAQHDHVSQGRGQPGDLFVHHAAQLGAERTLVGAVNLSLTLRPRARLLAGTPASGIGASAGRHTVGHAVQPRAEPVDIMKRVRPADEDQECRLECVVDVVGIGEPAAANAQDHPAVPLDQGLERERVAIGHEPLEQLRLVEAAHAAAAVQPVDVSEGRLFLIARHNASRADSPGVPLPLS